MGQGKADPLGMSGGATRGGSWSGQAAVSQQCRGLLGINCRVSATCQATPPTRPQHYAACPRLPHLLEVVVKQPLPVAEHKVELVGVLQDQQLGTVVVHACSKSSGSASRIAGQEGRPV